LITIQRLTAMRELLRTSLFLIQAHSDNWPISLAVRWIILERKVSRPQNLLFRPTFGRLIQPLELSQDSANQVKPFLQRQHLSIPILSSRPETQIISTAPVAQT